MSSVRTTKESSNQCPSPQPRQPSMCSERHRRCPMDASPKCRSGTPRIGLATGSTSGDTCVPHVRAGPQPTPTLRRDAGAAVYQPDPVTRGRQGTSPPSTAVATGGVPAAGTGGVATRPAVSHAHAGRPTFFRASTSAETNCQPCFCGEDRSTLILIEPRWRDRDRPRVCAPPTEPGSP